MELIVHRRPLFNNDFIRNQVGRMERGFYTVFTFDGELKDKVWQSETISRLKIKDREVIDTDDKRFLDFAKKMHLIASKPTAGIIFNGVPFIGTNDGAIYTPSGKIMRGGDIVVDTEHFLDELDFRGTRGRDYAIDYINRGFEAYHDAKWAGKIDELTKISFMQLRLPETIMKIRSQQRDIDRFIDIWYPIRGFVVDNEGNDSNESVLYDASLEGIIGTETGRMRFPVMPRSVYQVADGRPVFLSTGERHSIIDGMHEIEEDPEFLSGKYYGFDWKEFVFPSRQPVYATNGTMFAVANTTQNKEGVEIRIAGLDSTLQIDGGGQRTSMLRFVEDRLLGDLDGRIVKDFISRENVFKVGENNWITSFSDKGLITVYDGSNTRIYNLLDGTEICALNGEYRFLSQHPQRELL